MTVKKIARWAVLAPLFILPFLALYVANEMYFPFITGKNFAFRVLVEITLAGWVVLALADKRYRPRFSIVLVSFGLLVLWMIVADAFALNPHKAFWSNFERMDGFVTLAHVFALFLIAGSVLTVEKLWRRWWMTYITAAAFVCLYAVLQFLGAAQIHQSDTRLDASLGNSEYLAGFLLLTIAVTLWQAFETKTKGLRNTLFAFAALQVLVLFGTGTRGTFVALIATAAIGSLLWLFTLGKRGRKGALVFLAAVLLFAGGFYAMRNAAFVQNSPNLSRFADISLGALETRFTIWGMALEGIKERPVTGWGHEGFNYVFNEYYEPSLYGQETWFDRAHNVYLDWAIAGGIPALLLFLLLGGGALFLVYRAQGLKDWERVLVVSALIGYGIQGLAVFDNLFTYIPIAMLLAYIHGLAARPVGFLDRRPEVKGVTLDAMAAPAAAVITLVLIYMVNAPTYAAGKDIIRGLSPNGTPETRLGHFKQAIAREPFATQEIREQLLFFGQMVMQSSLPGPVKAETVTYANEQIQKEIERAPNDARLYALQTSFLRSIGAFDTAREVGAKARALSPRKQSIIIEQGVTEWQDGDTAAARRFFEEAYALSPDNDELAAYAAAGHIITNDLAGGKALLMERFGTTTVNHTVLMLAYQEAKAWNDLIALLKRRYQEDSDSRTGYQLAMVYANAGRLAEARAQVQAVMAAHPESASDGAALLVQLGAR